MSMCKVMRLEYASFRHPDSVLLAWKTFVLLSASILLLSEFGCPGKLFLVRPVQLTTHCLPALVDSKIPLGSRPHLKEGFAAV